MRFLPLNHCSLIVELKNPDETLALLGALRAQPLPEIEEIIPAARTLMIRFSPEIAKAGELARRIARLDLAVKPAAGDALVEVPVVYDGEDLPEVATLTGLSVREVIRRHTEAEYLVAFCGFAPGFGYLVGGDPALQVPRRKTPRTKIPAGAVALAGPFTGVYPRTSPGGWQLIGTTPMKMWDLARTPPACFQPGYRVRFHDATIEKRIYPLHESEQKPSTYTADESAVHFSIVAAPLPALFQDLGRFGEARQGVGPSGALDRSSFKSANSIVGNHAATPCLELTGGITIRSRGAAIIGIAGAPRGMKLRNAAGQTLPAAPYTPIALEAGDEVTLTNAQAGTRSYLAVRGGFHVEKILGSASRDTLSDIGPEPVGTGSVLTIGDASDIRAAVSLHEAPSFVFPKPGDVVTLDLTLGPRTDWFTQEALAVLANTEWEVTPQSNRIGLRLAAAESLTRTRQDELPSEAVVNGALQVPADGKPLLFLADHPLTGGYPVIGAVAAHHLDLAGQIPIGAKIRFRLLGPFQEIQPAPKEPAP
ncbi:MAG: carboxyltransferase domain-containing protein [Proteobacteria bacterium]|nr:carboxyltransferase domain-containing protein [Pseudomonadota bacterium]MBU6424816.1 carboxyltransferase domain-containing protein [Rhodospirillales bacterium]